MKKKAILAIAVALVAAVAVVALVSCISTPFDFSEKLKDAKNWTIHNESDGVVQEKVYDNGNYSETVKSGDKIVSAEYLMIEGDKYIAYSYDGSNWYKSEITKQSYDKQIKEAKPSEVSDINKDDVVKEGDYWFLSMDGETLKDGGFKVSGKKLTIYRQNDEDDTKYDEIGYIELSGKVKLPEDAKNAK